MSEMPLFDLPPINGTTIPARHASFTGAVHALETRSANVQALLQLWRQPLTIQDVAAITKLPISSVCSLKASIADRLVFVDYEIVEWLHRKPTKRCRWQLRREAK
jgi:hypothetical protein